MSRVRGLGMVVGLAVVLNLLGLVRIPGGPLAHESWIESPFTAFQQGNSVAVGATADNSFRAGTPLYMTVDVRSVGPFGVTLEGVEPVGRDGSMAIELLGVAPAWPVHDDIAVGSAIEIPAAWEPYLGRPLSGTVLEPGVAEPQYASILLALTVEDAGVHRAGPFAVDYRMGPFAFRYIYPVSYVLCTGEPGQPFAGECPEPTEEE